MRGGGCCGDATLRLGVPDALGSAHGLAAGQTDGAEGRERCRGWLLCLRFLQLLDWTLGLARLALDGQLIGGAMVGGLG